MSTTSIYDTLKLEYESITNSILSDYNDTSIKLQIFAQFYQEILDKIDYIKLQMFPTSATGEYLAKHGELKGIIKKDATKSEGYVTFYPVESRVSSITIPVGTLCTCSLAPELIYETLEEVTIKSSDASATSRITSVNSGYETTVATGYIDVLVNPIDGIDRITNLYKTDGGSDSESDEQYRKRVIESYSKFSTGGNLNYYEQIAKTDPNIWYASANFEEGSPNKINIYVQNATQNISDDALADIRAVIEEYREVGMEVAVQSATSVYFLYNISVRVSNLANKTLFYTKINDAFYDTMRCFGIGEYPSQLQISKALSEIEGLNDVIFTTSNNPVSVGADQIPVFGSVTVTYLED